MPPAAVSERWRWIGADAPGSGAPRWRAYAWAVASVAAVTGLDALLLGRTAEANLIMAYLLGTLPVGLRGDPGAGVFAAVLGVLAFDVCFVPPYLTIAFSDSQYLFTFLAMGLAVGTVATLTARLAAGIVAARAGEAHARALHELSRALLAARAPADVLATGAAVLGREIGLPVAAWLAEAPAPEEGRWGPGEPSAVAAPDVPLTTSEAETLRAVIRDGEAAGPGTERLPGSGWLFVPVPGGALGARVDRAHGAAVRASLETGANQLAVALGQARAREEAEAARRLAEAEGMRTALLSAVSHDLRTPLTGIVGAASALAEGAEALDAATRRELAEDIRGEGERLARLVANLLQATRLEHGAVTLAREPLPVDELVAPALRAVAPLLAGRPVTADVPPGLPPVLVDPLLVGQVLTNLLENAARHTPAGTPVAVRASRRGDAVALAVSDAGPGLAPGEEEAVFQRFHRGRAPGRGPGRAHGDGGAGLGLAIARAAVLAHGGTIAADRAPEGGARFTFTLPIA